MIPVGILLGMGVGEIHNFGGYLASAIIQAVAAGTFLYVIFMESLPVEFENEQDPFLKVTFLLLGFILMACLRAITVDNWGLLMKSFKQDLDAQRPKTKTF